MSNREPSAAAADSIKSSSGNEDVNDTTINKIESEAGLVEHNAIPRQRWKRAYRSSLFNIVLIGLIALTQTGLWTALNNIGAGGAASPYLVNAGSAITFGIMAVGCSVAGVLANKYGLKLVLVSGTVGYVPWFAALYMNNRYATEWFLPLAATLCGLSASALWATEGAIAVSYPHTEDRATASAIWLGLRQAGQIVGTSIQLAFNINEDEQGSVVYTVFYVFIAIGCLGLPISLMVSSPHKAIRRKSNTSKGLWTIVSPRSPGGWRATAADTNLGKEFKRLWQVLKLKHMLLLIPLLITFDMNRTFIGIYLTLTFSVRSRALVGLVSGFAQLFADIFWGWFLDQTFFSRPRRAQWSWLAFSVMMFATLSWLTYNEHVYGTADERPTLDWTTDGFGIGFAPPVLLYFLNEGHYIFCYYLIGSFHGDVKSATLAAGIVRSFESLGSAVAFGLGSAEVAPMVNLIVSFVAFAVSVPPTALVTFMIPDTPKDFSAVVALDASAARVENEEKEWR